MQSARYRWLILLGVFIAGCLLSATIDTSRVEREARWPTDTALFSVDAWLAQPARVQHVNGAQLVTRTYRRPGDGPGTATLVLATSTNAKAVYRVGADVPLQANGYTVEPAPAGLVPAAAGRDALLFRSGDEVGLVLYAYGERRGLLGNGPLGWGLVAADATLGRPNDYFRVFVVAPLQEVSPEEGRAVATLADTLFTRLAAWYGDTAHAQSARR